MNLKSEAAFWKSTILLEWNSAEGAFVADSVEWSDQIIISSCSHSSPGTSFYCKKMNRSGHFRLSDFTLWRAVLLIFIWFSAPALFAQTWDDKEYKEPESLNPGMLDTLPIFDPNGIKMVEGYVNAHRLKKAEKLEKGHAYFARIKFDDQQRFISGQTFSLGSYSVVRDRFVGFHTETYEHRYPSEDRVVIDYSNTKELTQYTWFYKDSRLQECRYYRGEYPFLQAFWKWDYSEDTLLLSVTKYDADTIPIYHSSYAHTDFGKVSQIQTTAVEKEVKFAIFEYNEYQQLTSAAYFKSLKKVPRKVYAIRDGVFVRISAGPIEEEKMSAKRWIYRYDEEGRLKETTELNKQGDIEIAESVTYNSAGSITSKHFTDSFGRVRGIYYNLNEDGNLTSIDSKMGSEMYPDRNFTFELDSRGNVVTSYFHSRSWFIRLDFDYEYFE